MTGETILVVEDDGLIALYLTELLEKTGYRVGSVFFRGDGNRVPERIPRARSYPDGHRSCRIVSTG